ncbi:MAG: porin [Aquificaceae bacterium]
MGRGCEGKIKEALKGLNLLMVLMGLSALPSKAAVIELNNGSLVEMELKLRIWAQRGKDYTDFKISTAEISFTGDVHKMVEFSSDLEFSQEGAEIGKALINLKHREEFQVRVGFYELPFSRITLTSSSTYYIATGYGWKVENNAFDPVSAKGDKDTGLTLWGNLWNGLFKYQMGVFDGKYENGLAFAGRVQFTPTWLGFKAEKDYSLEDTYLGDRKVLSIGFGYNNPGALVVDALWEQKFKDIVPNLQLGFQDSKDKRGYYTQGQLLYDQALGIGKPALGIRYERHEDKTSTERFSVFFNYYIKGQDAKMQCGFDYVKDSLDFTLAFQTQF